MSKRGSIWNKWDLHLHSPKTFLANLYNDCSVENFVQAIVNADIKTVALTNYFRFDQADLGGYKATIK